MQKPIIQNKKLFFLRIFLKEKPELKDSPYFNIQKIEYHCVN